MAFNEYENMHSTIRTVDQLLEDIQDLDRAVNQYQWANEKQGDFIRKVYERLGIFQDEEEDEGVNVDECFNKALSELDSRLSYFEGTSQKAIARSDRHAEWLNDIEAELFGERIETFTHGDHERQSERINDILVAAKDKASQMPKGVDWPRFKDGEPVRFLDDFERYGNENSVSTVTMYQDGSFALNFRAYSKGERVNRPAPKVLDADGVEVHKGDTVWSLGGGGPYTVAGFDGGTPYVLCDDGAGNVPALEPSALTHRAPVLAADGEPLEVGQTVWTVDAGIKFEVHSIEGDTVWGSLDGDCTDDGLDPKSLTHERPVPDADGIPIRVGDTVWYRMGAAHGVVESIDAGSLMHTVRYRSDDGEEYRDAAKDLTHQRPVLDADGAPIKVGDTVWNINTGDELLVDGFDGRFIETHHPDGEPVTIISRRYLTHTKPEPTDTYAKLYEDVHDKRCGSEEFVLRCRALAGVSE